MQQWLECWHVYTGIIIITNGLRHAGMCLMTVIVEDQKQLTINIVRKQVIHHVEGPQAYLCNQHALSSAEIECNAEKLKVVYM